MIRFFAVVACALAVLAAAPGARARDGFWVPSDLYATEVSRDDMIAAYRRGAGALEGPASFVAAVHFRSGSMALDGTVTVAGADYALAFPIEGQIFSMGRTRGRFWRSSGGVTHYAESDIQGDDLDRWPIAAFSLPLDDCVAGGETKEPKRWVLECRPPRELPRWVYLDPATGDVVSEVLREGARVTTFTFSGYAERGEARRPVRWQVGGSGPAAGVSIDASATAAPLANVAPAFAHREPLAAPATATIPFGYVTATINGIEGRFVIDTGTPEIAVSEAFAKRVGLENVLGNVVLPNLSVAGLTGSLLTARCYDLHSIADGILGYDFFLGHIVHFDYGKKTIDIIEKTAFSPPPDALAVPLDVSEGLPLAAGRIGSVAGDRFALDTGSSDIVVFRYFEDRAPDEAAKISILEQRTRREGYLEGDIFVRTAQLGFFAIGPFNGTKMTAELEVGNRGDSILAPFDAIVGTNVLQQLEWWFDYDDATAWARRR